MGGSGDLFDRSDDFFPGSGHRSPRSGRLFPGAIISWTGATQEVPRFDTGSAPVLPHPAVAAKQVLKAVVRPNEDNAASMEPWCEPVQSASPS